MPGGEGAFAKLKAAAVPLSIAALAGAFAASEYARVVEGAAMKRDLAEARADASAALASAITPETIHAAEDSVYLVAAPSAYGTAFVIDRERGLLATAAHVVASLDGAGRDDQFTVVNRLSKEPLRIRGAQAHQGYLSLTKLLDDYQPIERSSRLASLRAAEIFDTAFDVGLIAVDPLTADGAPSLAPAFPIADTAALFALKSGDPVATVSYPEDAGGTDKSVASRADRGVIAALLEPVDYTESAATSEFTSVIAHRMTTKAGSSGAPVFNRTGEVIGVHMAGARSDGLAVRADAILELLDGVAGEAAAIERSTAHWETRLKRYASAKDAIPYALWRLQTGGAPARMETLNGVDFAEKRPYEATSEIVMLGAVQDEMVLVDPSEPEKKTSGDESRIVSEQQRAMFSFPFTARFAIGEQALKPGSKNVLYAFDYTAGATRGFCRIGFYYRRFGETRFRVAGPGKIASARLDPGFYQVLYFRPADGANADCAETNAFMAGVVSWPSDDPAPLTAPPATVAAAPASDRVFEALANSGKHAAFCLFSVGPGKWCPPEVKAELMLPAR